MKSTTGSEFVSIKDMIAELEAEPGGKERMDEARKRVKKLLADPKPFSIRSYTIPQDDRPEHWRLADCVDADCDFDPYTDDTGHDVEGGEESWHYKRRCVCGKVWFSTHCVHEQPHRTCGSCES